MQDKVSIIIPVYNVEEFLAECLDSVIAQTYPNIEIILINDCSPDNSDGIVQKYIAKYPDRFSYFKNAKNIGQGPSRNIGIANATGEYIYFLDSDDLMEPTGIEILYNKIISDDYAFVMGGFSSYIFEYNKNNWRKEFDNLNNQLIKQYINNFHCCKYALPVYACGSLYHKKTISSEYNKFDAIYGEDLVFFSKILVEAVSFGAVEHNVFVYRLNKNSLTHSFHSLAKIELTLTKLIEVFTTNNKLNDETTAFILSHYYNLSKGIRLSRDKYKLFKFIQQYIPILDTSNPYFAEPIINPTKRKKLIKIYSSNGKYWLFHPNTKVIKGFLKNIFSIKSQRYKHE